jgi:hypothetical protein
MRMHVVRRVVRIPYIKTVGATANGCVVCTQEGCEIKIWEKGVGPKLGVILAGAKEAHLLGGKGLKLYYLS